MTVAERFRFWRKKAVAASPKTDKERLDELEWRLNALRASFFILCGLLIFGCIGLLYFLNVLSK